MEGDVRREGEFLADVDHYWAGVGEGGPESVVEVARPFDAHPVHVTVAAPDAAAPAGSFAVPAARAPAADPSGDGQVRCFNPVFYAGDVVPLVTLGQRSTWYPNRAAPWGTAVDTWLNIATLLGWVLSSILPLSFTRLVRTA